ncbi:MAG: diguanylate cyclase [Firmicutes bacterium]|nr:diguanylate cyclase [Bacillota bacterium]
MRVLLATGLSELEKQLELELKKPKRCYHRSAVITVADSFKPEVVVLSPRLMGDEDIFNDVVRPLRAKGIRVIYLPGNINLGDCREAIQKLVPLGVYCYVFDPVLAGKIVFRIENPGKLGDLPEELQQASLVSDDAKRVGAEMLAKLGDPVEERKEGLIDKLSGSFKSVLTRVKPQDQEPAQETPHVVWQRGGGPPEPETINKRDEPVEDVQPIGQPAVFFPPTAPAAVPDDRFIWFERFASVQHLVDYEGLDVENSDGIIVPSDFPGLLSVIQNIRRSIKLASLPVVVVGKCDENKCFLSGADECVPALDENTIPRILARSRRLKEMWEKANRDDLTRAYKRNFIEEYIGEQIRLFQETEVVFSVALIDLDKFKGINDTYGHEAGDILLKEFAGFLARSVRQLDLVARWGGDEFLIVFPRTGPRETAGIMERLWSAWSKVTVALPRGKSFHASFSVGVAAYTSGINIVDAADKSLYQAKSEKKRPESLPPAPQAPSQPPEPPRLKPFVLERPSISLSLPKRQIAPPGLKLSSQVLTICSPWMPEVDTAGISIAIAKALARKGIATAIIDADFKKAEIASRLEVPTEDLWKFDWRKAPIALSSEKNLFILPLDPMFNKDLMPHLDYQAQFKEALSFLKEEMGNIQKIIINSGGDPSFNATGDKILVVSSQLASSDVIDAWKFYQPFSDGVILSDNINLANSFGLPTLGVFNPADLGSTANLVVNTL